MSLKELFKGKLPERSILEMANCSIDKDGRVLQNGIEISSGDAGEILQRAIYRVENGAIVSNKKP